MNANNSSQEGEQYDRDSTARKVAVIAVHGVSDQKPFASAREVTNLLIDLEETNERKYSPFQEKIIRLRVKSFFEKKLQRTTITTLEFFKKFFENSYESKENVDHQFAEKQIKHYQHPSVYETICLEGELLSNQGEKEKSVHIYEMYWADLSRLGTNSFRIFGELYQILFHFSIVGTQVVELAQINLADNMSGLAKCALNTWMISQKIASYLITNLIPIFNLYLLIVAFLSVPTNLIDRYATEYLFTIPPIVLFITGLASAFFVGKVFFKRFNRNPFIWIISQLSIGCLLAFIVNALSNSFVLEQDFYKYLISIVWFFILFILCKNILISRYEINQPGVLFTFKSGIIAIFAFLLYKIAKLDLVLIYSNLSNNASELITYISLNLIEIIYFILFILWFLFNLFYTACFVSGIIVFTCRYFALKNGYSQEIKQLKRAVWTSLTSLLLPSFIYLLITLTLWSVLNSLGSSLIRGLDRYNPIIFNGLKNSIYLEGDITNKLTQYCIDNQADKSSDCFLQSMSDFASTPLMTYAFVGFVITLIVVLWALFPAILIDIYPPQDDQIKEYSQSLGNWLDNGFQVVVVIIFIFVCVLIPLCAFLSYPLSFNYFFGVNHFLGIELAKLPLADNTEPSPIFNITAYLLTFSAGSLIAFGSTLKKVSLGLRGVLDAALDVDNYLRLDPPDKNPRAQIYSRYLALLNHICSQSAEPYDAIVIIAHSQGTVITADLLRFLKYQHEQNEQQLVNLPNIYFFTMGSPIRQLYSFSFPHLYHWVYNSSEDDGNPNPDKLQVKQWVNAYRSGDYIGRYLWQSDNYEKIIWQEDNRQVSRREFCIGAGGHTHYWDRTAPEIAHELDRLIRKAEKK